MSGRSLPCSWLHRSLRSCHYLGAASAENGTLQVDDHQRTSVEGLYAAGDVVTDLHQLSVAFGHAAIAATDIHNRLPRNCR
jgi:thioredoxin reductase (NADPH)